MELALNLNKKKVVIKHIEICKNKAIGLMFSQREKAPRLLFNFKKSVKLSIHSLFVFYPFVAVWLHRGNIIDIKKIKPFKISIKPDQSFDQLLEIPINAYNKKLIEAILK